MFLRGAAIRAGRHPCQLDATNPWYPGAMPCSDCAWVFRLARWLMRMRAVPGSGPSGPSEGGSGRIWWAVRATTSRRASDAALGSQGEASRRVRGGRGLCDRGAHARATDRRRLCHPAQAEPPGVAVRQHRVLRWPGGPAADDRRRGLDMDKGAAASARLCGRRRRACDTFQARSARGAHAGL